MSPDVLFASAYGPLLIFLVRIVDVSLSTVRSLMVMRGQKTIAPAVAFFESLLWVFAVGTAIQNLDSPWHVLGYAAGFATGNLVGLWIEEKLAIGLATVRIVSRFGGVELAEALREVGHGVTEFLGQGREGRVEFIYTVVKRREVPRILSIVDRWDPDAFVSVEEPRTVRRGQLFRKQRK